VPVFVLAQELTQWSMHAAGCDALEHFHFPWPEMLHYQGIYTVCHLCMTVTCNHTMFRGGQNSHSTTRTMFFFKKKNMHGFSWTEHVSFKVANWSMPYCHARSSASNLASTWKSWYVRTVLPRATHESGTLLWIMCMLIMVYAGSSTCTDHNVSMDSS
jgi:hypothetical protein